MAEPQAYLLILGHREGLAWVLKNSRMAFTTSRVSEGARLGTGDRLFLYTSRGCFGNPTRDRGRIIGDAIVTAPLRRRRQPVRIADHEYTHDCELELKSLAPFREGVILAELVSDLRVFPDPSLWSFRLRRVLLLLPAEDAAYIADRLATVAGPVEGALGPYLAVA